MKSAIIVAMTLWALPQQGVAPLAHPLVGEWKISFPWHVEVRDGVVKADMDTGTLTVEVHGDSLIATLLRDPASQPSRRPRLRLAAPLRAGEAVFVMRDRVTFNARGVAREATAISTWVLRANGDRLDGTLERRLEGVDGAGVGPQPLTGSRVRS